MNYKLGFVGENPAGLCPAPHQGNDSPGPSSAEWDYRVEQTNSRCCLKKRSNMLPFASGPAAESRQPGCCASGGSRRIIPRKEQAFSWGFSRLSMGQKLLSFVFPARQAEVVCLFHSSLFAYWCPEGEPLWRGVWGRGGPRASLQTNPNFSLMCEPCFALTIILCEI